MGISTLQVFINVSLGHAVEAEVVQDVAEVRNRDVTGLLLVVKVEGILKVGKDVTWERELSSLARVHASSVYAFVHFSYFNFIYYYELK